MLSPSGLQFEGITKRYGSLLALDEVSASMRGGEVHAILGENGAGKSTLVSVLAGFVRPESGRVLLSGQPLELGNPRVASQAGIQMVHQHFMLVPEFSVDENLALAHMPSLRGTLSLREQTRAVHDLAQKLGWKIDGRARTGDLPVGVQQRIEILKALSKPSSVLVLDEPTAVLGADEVEDLFRVLRDLRAEGRLILLIAHKLSEVMQIADRVTVLRRGRKVAEAEVSQTNPRQLAEWMVGDLPAPAVREAKHLGDVVLRAKTLNVRDRRKVLRVQDFSLEVRKGEIIGIGGVDGNGQTELAEALAGLRKPESGTLDLRTQRLVYIPQDRQVEGLALPLSIFENLMVEGHQHAQLRLGPFLRVRAARAWAQEQVANYQIKTDSIDRPARSLSGGNQQKVVVARTLSRKPELIIAMNPTRGLDLQAADYVHQCLRKASEQGAGVVLLSTDQDEIAALADRAFVMSRGRLLESDLVTALESAT